MPETERVAPDEDARTVVLRNGVRIPRVGLGVFRSPSGETTRQAVLWALEAGYRHIDTARIYGNEADVGTAIRQCGIPRDEIFITTKLWNTDHGYFGALRACEASLRRLGLDHVDLFLVHWPVEGQRRETWRAMEQLLGDGKTRAIGVSNYMDNHLEELIASADVLPAVNQIEVSPFLQQRDVRRRCRELGILVEAYSPLTKGHRLGHGEVAAVAVEVGRTPAQVLIRWAIENSLVPLPKSTRRERILENIDVFDFELSRSQLARLNALEEGFHTGWDPTDAP
jgi:diketogulonate reductase-like aldo/keto reductase